MLTSPTLLSNMTAANKNSASDSLSQLGNDYNKFLTLLTAQIQNQDPLEPVDSTQFVAQLAQLSQVEQAVQTNTQLETVSSQISGLLNLGGTDLLGRDVTIQSDTVMLKNGATATTYEVGEAASEVTAKIIDPLGRTIRTITGLSVRSGTQNQLGWDGKDDYGNPQLDGIYSVQLAAKNTAGEAVNIQASRSARVEDVRFQEGEIVFGLDGGETASSVTIKSAR
tara:strand:+ start:2119 stop:2790 length:672 start_codon:yes stop_codon:yes gene_type:complete